jgi:hypothetical protein
LVLMHFYVAIHVPKPLKPRGDIYHSTPSFFMNTYLTAHSLNGNIHCIQ